MILQQTLDLRFSWFQKKGDLNRMTTQIEVTGNKKFFDINRNNVNRGNVNRGITVLHLLLPKRKYIMALSELPILVVRGLIKVF